jgi:hypothetical protein
MNNSIHILNQMGVLTSFNVAKRITEKEINKYCAKHRKSGKSERQIKEMLKEKILSDISHALQSNEIPGLISDDKIPENFKIDKEVLQRMPELNRLIMIIATKISEKQYDTMSLCYFINSLVNVLGLSEDDFTKFHRQNGPVDEETDNEENDDEDDNNEFGSNA